MLLHDLPTSISISTNIPVKTGPDWSRQKQSQKKSTGVKNQYILRVKRAYRDAVDREESPVRTATLITSDLCHELRSESKSEMEVQWWDKAIRKSLEMS